MSNVLPAHIEDALEDLWLWKNIDMRNARTEKMKTYKRMMGRRDVEKEKIPQPKAVAENP